MGVYDIVHTTIKCPYCGKEMEVNDQIKWPNRELKWLTIGDEVYADDGTYEFGSYTRPNLHTTCKNCFNKIKFAVKVEDSKIKDIYSVENDRPDFSTGIKCLEKYFGIIVVNGTKYVYLDTGKELDSYSEFHKNVKRED